MYNIPVEPNISFATMVCYSILLVFIQRNKVFHCKNTCQAHWAGRFSPDIVPDVGFIGVVAPGITVH